MGQVAGVKNKGGGFGFSLDLRDRRAKGRRHIGVGRFVEPDVAVADLDEAQPAPPVRLHRRMIRLAKR